MSKKFQLDKRSHAVENQVSHALDVIVDRLIELRLEMMDGAPCAADAGTAVVLRRGSERVRPGFGVERTTGGWRHCAPAHLFIPGSSFCFNTHTHTHSAVPVPVHNIGLLGFFPPDLLNLASDSGTCY